MTYFSRTESIPTAVEEEHTYERPSGVEQDQRSGTTGVPSDLMLQGQPGFAGTKHVSSLKPPEL